MSTILLCFIAFSVVLFISNNCEAINPTAVNKPIETNSTDIDSFDWGYCQYNGPAGNLGCVQLEDTLEKQYVVCLPQKYLEQKSRGQHYCARINDKYCWYSCTKEMHGKWSELVSDDCACKDRLLTSPAPLKEKCQVPDGSDCSFYRDCLNIRNQCLDNSAGGAVEFAEEFCNLKTITNYNFSSITQKWINETNQCLQMQLSTAIRPYFKGGCEGIRKIALATYNECYRKPIYNSADSYRNKISCTDWFTAFLTIKTSLVSSISWEIIDQFVQTSRPEDACFLKEDDAFWKKIPFGRLGSVHLKLNATTQDENRSLKKVDEVEFAIKITDVVAKRLDWVSKRKQIDWFAYGSIDKDNTYFVIWLFNKQKQDKDIVGNEIKRFLDWIESGKNYLDVTVNGVQFTPISIGECVDSGCLRGTHKTIIAGPRSRAPGLNKLVSNLMTAVSICILFKFY